MKQKLILLAMVIGLTIVSQTSLSLGMGKIQVYSSLNEPLRSSIDLITNADEELENLQVKLASSEDYQKVGLDKSFVPANIMVNLDADNPYQINVTSNGPVTEPIVSLLLDVEWANGRILREFTVLLDPPVYETSNVDVQVNSVVVEPIVEEVTIEPIAEVDSEIVEDTSQETITYTNEDVAEYEEQAQQQAPVEVIEEPVYSSIADEVTVEAGDTLWRIANNNKVGDLTTHQMMMAIYNNNPNAFIDNNINQLIKGSRLDLPTLEEASNIGYSEALAQVKSHNQSWNPATPDYSTIQTETTVEDTYQEPETTLDYGVQLSGSDAGDSDNGQSNAGATSDESTMALEEDLLTTDTENTELKERISELEDIVDQQQEVIQISDDGLANLENQLGNSADEAVDNAEDAITEVVDDANQLVDETITEAENAVDDVWDSEVSGETVDGSTEDGLNLAIENVATATDDAQTAGNFETEGDSADSAVVEEAAEKETSTPSVIVQRKPEPSFIEKAMNWVTSNLMWVLIGLGALLALIFVPRFLGGSDEEEEDGTSFLDDIKNRNHDNEDSDDAVDTKMNQPLMSDEPEIHEEAEGDVLADLDRSIDFEDTDNDLEEIAESDGENDNEFESDESLDEEDGFDLDGFLNDEDDFESDKPDTVDHAETLADVSFDEEESSSEQSNEELGDFELDDLNLDEDLGELSSEAEDSIEDIVEDAEEAIEDIVEDAEDAIDEAEESVDDEFSFDDESFDFDLDDELEELEDMEGIEESASSDEAEQESVEEEFNDMLDLSDEGSEDSFETIDDENSMDDEIDLGLEDLMDDGDTIGTKLDLAKAYIDMGDSDSAKNLLDEVFAEGSEEQISEAKKLLDDM